MGKVYLVGAGCGNIELYTLKAICRIKEADCIVYDSLVDQQILECCKKDCELIFVGKRASHHSYEQEEINQLLVDLSKKYNHVVRLKGGDVFVFGRGGEEGEFLYRNGVPFEVVPGLSSSIAGLDYAGIPVTHRGISTGFQVYTATRKKGDQNPFDYSTMLNDSYTYIFLMGIGKLEEIVNGFLQAGKHPNTKVAIVSNASLPLQRTLVGTLDTIIDLFKQDPLPTPGIIVVGEVIRMREYLNFYETAPLFGKKILVARVGEDHYIRDELISYGGNVVEVQTGDIEYLTPKIPELDGYLIFTSRHGVIGFMNAFLQQYHDVRKLYNVIIVAIGNKTNQALQEYGISADWIPDKADSEAINAKFQNCSKKVYLVKGEFKSDINYYNEEFVVYRNNLVKIDNKQTGFDYAFFTNASSVERFYHNNKSKISTFISIGKHTSAKILECYPGAKIIEPNRPSKELMVKVLLDNEKAL